MSWWEWFNTVAGGASLISLAVTVAAIVHALLGNRLIKQLHVANQLTQKDIHAETQSTLKSLYGETQQTLRHLGEILERMDQRAERMDQRADERHREVVQAIQALRG